MNFIWVPRVEFKYKMHFIAKQNNLIKQNPTVPKLSASEGQRVAARTVATLQHIRDEESFNLFLAEG